MQFTCILLSPTWRRQSILPVLQLYNLNHTFRFLLDPLVFLTMTKEEHLWTVFVPYQFLVLSDGQLYGKVNRKFNRIYIVGLGSNNITNSRGKLEHSTKTWKWTK
jgi:hypothetical protein